MPLLLRLPLRWLVATLLVVAVLGPAAARAHAADVACAGGGDGYTLIASVQSAAVAADKADIVLVTSCQSHCASLPGSVRIPLAGVGLAETAAGADADAAGWFVPVETGPPRV